MRDQSSKFAVEKLSDIIRSPADWARIQQLLYDHWNEVTKHPTLRKLAPDFAKYQALERDNRLQIVVLRVAGEIVGYSVHFLTKGHPHYKDLYVAEDDIHYIVPSLRGSAVHDTLRRVALRELRGRGIQIVTARLKVDGRGHSTLVRLGYEPEDTVYTLNLKEWNPGE